MIKLYPRRIFIKLVLFLTVFYAIFISIKLILSQPNLRQYSYLIDQKINLKYNEIYFNLLASKHDFDSNTFFQKQVEKITETSITNDKLSMLWNLEKSGFKQEDTSIFEIETPSYFFENIESPMVQPFDSRFTIGIYYQYLQNVNSSVPFHWSDWVDLSKIYKFLINIEDTRENVCSTIFDISSQTELIKGSQIKQVEEYCRYEPDSLLGYKIIKETGPQTVQNRELLGKSYLFSTAPSPRKLIFLTNNGSFQANVETPLNQLENSILYNDMINNLQNPTKVNVLHNYNSLISSAQLQQQHITQQELTYQVLGIPKADFNIDPETVINQLSSSKLPLSDMEQQFLSSLKFSHGNTDPPKYFYEAKLLNSIPDDWQGEHYDWRFFNGLTVGKDKQAIVLHRLVKNYLNFARNHGIITWIAHGSLLSWYWNGMAFPWDTDIDVQMPIAELYKLGQHFNQTLVIENAADANGEFDGMGRYFVDVGSSITSRIKGNGNNAIDARFIDVDTGLYIDITALAMTDAKSPSRYDSMVSQLGKDAQMRVKNARGGEAGKDANYEIINSELQLYNCRNNHFTSYAEISPLVRTTVENQISYIPYNFITILNDEYNLSSLSKKNHRAFTFLNNLRLWFDTKIIKSHLDRKNSDISSEELTYGELHAINKLSVKDHLNLLASNPALLKEWLQTHKFTKLHSQELKLIRNQDFKSVQNLQKDKEIGKPLRSDLFMDLVHHDEDLKSLSFEERAKKFSNW
ncbi:hypothetical protein KGF56_002793 [Candida oxycetoniae]|uniref:LicD/FKTN/FKRP nucleotidyltransferase domain-containing protein n=1 Tax=Candida oxycetoniae TaxID=497107 RepID=A0AAI9WXK2_9ASCO|nr:uncharacterized protein KGF56_002793 [Candida oxycetoniae]KAI3404396.2 hypothetical protein KGF56_002793 [Candida oxycetoniae]